MPDRIATARHSGEESSLREKVAQAILHVQETNRSAFPNNLELADAAIAVCMEEAAKVAEAHAGQIEYDLEPEAAVAESVTARSIAEALRTLDKRLEKTGKGE